MKNIPHMDLTGSNKPLLDEISDKFRSMVASSEFIGGPEIDLFEKEFAAYCRVPYAVAAANGTDAIALVLKALGIGPGMAVIVPANSFIATSEAVSMVGASVEFIDVSDSTLTMDPAILASFLDNRKSSVPVKAVIPVNLYGQMTDIESIMAVAKKYNLFVIEDSAQAHGSSIKGIYPGQISHAATFSFYPGKNLGAFGDAGAVVTSDKELALKMKKLANHGRIAAKYDHELEGYNMRMDSIQAAILRIKLKHLDNWTQLRREKATLYRSILTNSGIRVVDEFSDANPVYHLLVMRTQYRDELKEYLNSKGIHAAIHYPTPIPMLKAYSHLLKKESDFPISVRAAQEIISLPLWPEISISDVEMICSEVIHFLEQRKN